MSRVITLPCISLRQPYASLVASGAKTLETRTGPVLSRHRGPLLIASSKGRGAVHDEYPDRAPYWSNPPGWERYPYGRILAVVNVVATGKPVGRWRWRDSITDHPIPALLPPADAYELETWRESLRVAACFGSLGTRWLTVLKKATWLDCEGPPVVRGYQGLYKAEVVADYLPAWAVTP